MTRIFASALAALTLAPMATFAQGGAPMTYDQFEVSVPHTDLATCPEDMAQDGVFCRATLNYEQIHVFAFSEEGSRPFVAFKSYPAEGLIDLLK